MLVTWSTVFFGDVVVEVVGKVVHQDAEKEDMINMVTK